MRRSTIVAIAAGLVAIGAALAALLSDPSSDEHRARRACDAILVMADTATDHGRSPEDRDTVERFANSLRNGEVGCLRGGTYAEDVTVSNSHFELRSYRGERARLAGRLWIRREAHDVTIRGLTLDGRNEQALPSPTVNGQRIRFTGVDVTNGHTGICFIIGSEEYGRAEDVVIENSRIHACGTQPANNTEHGIYVAAADDTRIVGNKIYDNADRGIQLYPDAQRTLIERNVIDGNGQGIIFSGGHHTASNDNVVQHNAITNSRIRANVESYYSDCGPVGEGNIVRDNCIFGAASADIDTSAGGFEVDDNTIADPGYEGAARGRFAMDPDGPCAGILTGD